MSLNAVNKTTGELSRVAGRSIGGDIQLSSLPTASSSELNNIRQYTGDTNNDLVNGYYYKCIEDPNNSGSYIWVQTDVQPAANISGKADKVSSPTSGNFAGLDQNGNLTDSGSKASDFASSSQGGKADTAIQSIKINGTEQTKTDGVVNLPAYPTSLPASDTTSSYSATGTAPVNGTAVAEALSGLTASSVGLGNVGNFKAVSTVASQGLTTTEQSNARANIGAASVLDLQKTLTTTGWTGSAAPYSQAVTCTGITSNDTPFIDLVVSSTTSTGLTELENWAYISRAVTSSNTITFYCYEAKPTVALTVNIKAVRSS